MNRHNPFNFGGITCLIAAVYVLYYLLLRDNVLPLSIHSVVSGMNHWSSNWHVLVIGLLPIYLAMMFFGTAMFGMYFGSALQRWLTSICKK
jgi:hypothetical protein